MFFVKTIIFIKWGYPIYNILYIKNSNNRAKLNIYNL